MDRFILHSRFYHSRLSDPNQKIYREIYDSWAMGKSEVFLNLEGNGFSAYKGLSLHDLVTYIIADNPHLFHLETSQIEYKRKGHIVSILTLPIYTKSEYEMLYNKLLMRVNTIKKSLDTYSTQQEKVKYIHDELADNINYCKGANDKKSQREVHTIVGALLNRACVCDGYSRAMRLLCDYSGISCIVVNGIGVSSGGQERHAWNIIKLRENTYHVDVTWDSNLSNEEHVSDIYFMRSDEVAAREHIWDRSFYPPCLSDYGERKTVYTYKELNELIRILLMKPPEIYSFELSKDIMDKSRIEKCFTEALSQYCNTYSRQTKIEYSLHEPMRCVKIKVYS